ncbi:hypothetical protein, partial [Segetibacter sp.]|uniref:hypothetical protein n=1 Tax=Segetibacter sp. TaxID=2231182 RepID=UPI00262B1D16
MNKRIFIIISILVVIITGFILSCNNSSAGTNKVSLPEVVSYNYHIRPILSDKCFACHGPDA